MALAWEMASRTNLFFIRGLLRPSSIRRCEAAHPFVAKVGAEGTVNSRQHISYSFTEHAFAVEIVESGHQYIGCRINSIIIQLARWLHPFHGCGIPCVKGRGANVWGGAHRAMIRPKIHIEDSNSVIYECDNECCRAPPAVVGDQNVVNGGLGVGNLVRV
jgi:hypothetical protein